MTVNYSEIHAYMLKKTQEYYANPPRVLIEEIQDRMAEKGHPVTEQEARALVTSIDIQRLVKREMQEKWPEFMATIPENPLRTENIQ